ncbi:Stage V sporulation protein E [[Clostridium] ultunense Esp]|uniref:Probable peptidoglycan glycosyltransferase FtsW n=1 Tax=[Clostridium] ultunense Esp TaxID=1288971 RepID=M1ZD82_9FIRM|nr:putative lipid II flippase FtsW [Schnuerera ultunensis]CCQ95848.1 Stage V sporulation protein E [[Clostridium] ultunense Esp]SHD77287.1 factor for spore cortex peptidoglycan synthesis (stage V sporulation) [[Clostridium] ultunense Esp]
MAKKVRKRACDFTLLLATLLLVFIGIIMVFSSSWPEGIRMNDGYYFLKKQIFAAGLGLIAMLFFMNFDYRIIKKMSRLIYFISLASGLLIFTPLGVVKKGARRWVDLGFTTFMPSDVIKLGSIIFLAAFLSKRKDLIKDFKKTTIPTMIIIGLSCGMIYLQKDLGTTVTLGMTLVSIFFVAGMKASHLLLMIIGASVGLVMAITSDENEYRMRRLTAFLDPFADKADTGWQAVQSLYALGSGGLFGLGLGKSRQKFFYIPEPYNDFIFAIIGEELGFLGGFTVILLFMVLIWRGIRIALNIEDLFGCLLATGIVALITVQSLIHIAVVTSSIPTTGIPLPFVSYGGTSLILYMSSVGILLNISRHVKLDRS